MTPALRDRVKQRAGNRCEYCSMPQTGSVLPHEVDHIRSQKHGGPTELANLCWACSYCNAFKGTDIAAYAPGTGDIVPLFNPRTDRWEEYFYWEGAVLRGKSTNARATIELLKINSADRIEHRQLLIRLGTWE